MKFKKLLTAVMAAALVISAVLIPAPAAALSAANGLVQSVVWSGGPGPFTVTASGKSLVLTNPPEGTAFNANAEFYVFLFDSNSKKHAEKIFTRAASYTYDLSSVPDGTYWLQVYSKSSQPGSYYSYIFSKEFEIVISGGGVSLRLSPVYENNVNICNAKSANTALILGKYLVSEPAIQSNDPKIIAMAAEITAGKSGDYNKLKAIYEWVADNIFYDYESVINLKPGDRISALGVLNTKRSVCQGYAYLTAALCRAAGIPCTVVTGYTRVVSAPWTDAEQRTNESNHAWNEAYADGRWVILDTTWASGNLYSGSKIATAHGLTTYKYFDITPAALSYTHKIIDDGTGRINEATLPDDWARAEIASAVNSGLVPPIMQNNYKTPATRAQFCALAVELYEKVTGAPITARAYFTDTDDINVSKIGGLGVVFGKGEGWFDPNGALTRQDAAVIIYRLLSAMGRPLAASAPTFADRASFADWSYNEIGAIQNADIMRGVGDNLFDPSGAYTWQQCVMTIGRVYSSII